jgi:hypothetical protein
MVSTAVSAPARSHTATALLGAFLLLPIVVAGMAIAVPGIMAAGLADDAFFFARYAQNFATEGVFSWNSGDPASFGNTSQLYQWLIAAIRAVAGPDPVRILAIGSQVPFALCATVILLSTARRLAGAALPRPEAVAILVLAGSAAALSPKFLQAALTGMDTALAACVAALYAVLADGIDRRSRGAQVAFVALGGWALILARPELGLIAVATPLALAIGERRLGPWILPGLAALAALVAASLMGAWLYYGQPLPSPFYVKSLGLSAYRGPALRTYGFGNLSELYLLIRDHALLALPLVAFGALAFSRRPAWWGLLGGSAAFLLYQALANAVPITSGGARFFMPVYPILALAAVWAAVAAAERSPLLRAILIGCAALQAALFLPPVAQIAAARVQEMPEAWSLRHDAHATMLLNWRGTQRLKWPALDRMGELPAGCSLATTELGLIGALYPGLRLVDFSGLIDLRLRHGLDADWLLERERPDILFPDPVAVYWSIELGDDPRYLELYDELRLPDALSPWPVAVRKDSACGQAYRAILEEEVRAADEP